MAGLNFQTEAEVGVVPDADRAFDQRWIAEDTEQQQTHTHACFKIRSEAQALATAAVTALLQYSLYLLVRCTRIPELPLLPPSHTILHQ
jgi:hypothetical protein